MLHCILLMGDFGKIIENFVLFATDTSLYLQLLVVENTLVTHNII